MSSLNIQNKFKSIIAEKKVLLTEFSTEYGIPIFKRNVKVGYFGILSPVKDSKAYEIPQHRWENRHWMFSKFDEGIILDEEGFFVSTPEKVAKRIAHNAIKFGPSNTVLEPFCGYGGQTVQLSKLFNFVYAYDNLESRVLATKNNLDIYGCENVDVIQADFFKKNFKDGAKFDWLILSPPWGSTYRKDCYSILDSIPNLMEKLFDSAHCACFYLPPNQNLSQLLYAIKRSKPSVIVILEYLYYFSAAKILVVYVISKLPNFMLNKTSFKRAATKYFIENLNEPLVSTRKFEYIYENCGFDFMLSAYLAAIQKFKEEEQPSRTMGGYFFQEVKAKDIRFYRVMNQKFKSKSKKTIEKKIS